MTKFLEKSIEDGSLVLWHSYRSWNGTFDDLSGNGNDGTPINDVQFRGSGVYFDPENSAATAHILVADSTELRLFDGTVFFFGNWDREERTNPDGARILAKRDAGGTGYTFRIDQPAGEIQMYDGTSLRVLAISYIGLHSISIGFEDGEIPDVYLDGVYENQLDGSISMTGDDADIYIGNFHVLSRNVYNPLWSVLLFNRKLTATEHSKLYGELMAIQRW